MSSTDKQATLFGHPTGLFALFFAEMWERFSYYGMRALLIYYMIKGFLGYGDNEAYRVYGAYTALVYMTPFIGGLIADRLLGPRRAVVFGGLLMAGGHLLMTLEYSATFFGALALLVVGNGFFKPNISTMVGSLYPPGSSARDGGFTIFYMGINLGAAIAPLLCGYVGETYGWHYGFGLATIGMLIGLAVFVVPSALASALILGGAITTALAMVLLQDNALLLAVNGFVALALVISGIVSFVALSRRGLSVQEQGLDADLGAPPDPELLRRPLLPGINLEWATYIITLITVPVVAALVWSNRTITLIPDSMLSAWTCSDSSWVSVLGNLAGEVSTPTGLILTLTGVVAFAYILFTAFRSTRVERDRIVVAVVLMGFSMLFWAFFEQAGSSVANFTDRNVDRVFEERVISEAEVGTTVTLKMTQEQLGLHNGEQLITLDILDKLRNEGPDANGRDPLEVDWTIDQEDVGMGVGGSVVPASTFQSANPIFILLFGLPFSALWALLSTRKFEPSTPVKFALGLAQLGLGFAVLWYGATLHDERGMVAMPFLILGYLLHTTGELCLSPVGLSMITRLSPTRLVSTMMGAWFLATAFSSYLSAIIATFTGVGHGGGTCGGAEVEAVATFPPPIDTVMVYGSVFGTIAVAALIAAGLLAVLSPFLQRGMHGEQ